MPLRVGVVLGSGVSGLKDADDDGEAFGVGVEDGVGVGVGDGVGATFSADLATQSSQEMFQSVQPLPCSIGRGLPVYSTGSPCFI
jgi:hypothetical protein